MPSGIGSPAWPSAARLEALGPNRAASQASRSDRPQMQCGASAPPCSAGLKACTTSPDMVTVTRNRIDDRDLLHREVRDDFDTILVDDEHFLDAHAPAEHLAVLCFEREHHAGLDLDRVIERPDARNHRRVVLGEAETMAPEVRGRLIFFLIAVRVFR